MISILFEGTEGIYRALGIAAEGLADFREPTQAALEVLSDSVLTRIVEGIHPDILPASRAARKFDGGTPALWDSGEMAEAATATHLGQQHSQYELSADGTRGQIGVDPLFHGARRHQEGFGTDRIGRTYQEPPRAFLVFGAGDRAKVVEVFDSYIGALASGMK